MEVESAFSPLCLTYLLVGYTCHILMWKESFKYLLSIHCMLSVSPSALLFSCSQHKYVKRLSGEGSQTLSLTCQQGGKAPWRKKAVRSLQQFPKLLCSLASDSLARRPKCKHGAIMFSCRIVLPKRKLRCYYPNSGPLLKSLKTFC